MGVERAILWRRVSSEEQAGDDRTSLLIQAEDTRRYAEERGYSVVGEYEGINDKSDKSLDERPQLLLLLGAVERGECDVIVCRVPDRLARHQRFGMEIVWKCKDVGVRVEFVVGQHVYDLKDPMQTILLTMAFVPGQVELARMKDRLQGGRRARVEKKERPLIGPRARYGYQFAGEKKGRLVENPDTAPIVRRIFRDVIAGKKLRRIATELTAEDIPTPTGKELWRRSTIQAMLKMPEYKGEAYGLKYVGRAENKVRLDYDNAYHFPDGTCERLVDPGEWGRVQVILAENKRNSSRKSVHAGEFLLRGHVQCGACGCTMRAQWRKRKGGPALSYRCSNVSIAAHTCGKQIEAEHLEREVWKKLTMFLIDPDSVAIYSEQMRTSDPTERERETKTKFKAGHEKAKANLMVALTRTDNETIQTPILQKMEKLAETIAHLDDDLADLAKEHQRWEEMQSALPSLEAWIAERRHGLDTMTMEERKQLLQELGVAVVVNPSTAEHRWDMTVHLPWAEILRRKAERGNSYFVRGLGDLISRRNDSLTEETARQWIEDEADPDAAKEDLRERQRLKPLPPGFIESRTSGSSGILGQTSYRDC